MLPKKQDDCSKNLKTLRDPKKVKTVVTVVLTDDVVTETVITATTTVITATTTTVITATTTVITATTTVITAAYNH